MGTSVWMEKIIHRENSKHMNAIMAKLTSNKGNFRNKGHFTMTERYSNNDIKK